jgi:hypothetical protein
MLQVGNVAAENFCTFLGLEPVARRIMQHCSGNEEFESTSTEARSEGLGWLEIIVQGKLGKNNAGKLAEAKQACAAHHSSGCSINAVWTRIKSAHSLELTSLQQARSASASSSLTSNLEFLLGHGQQCGRE